MSDKITFGKEEIAKISLENFIYLSALLDDELARRTKESPCKSCGGRYCFECMWTGIDGYRVAEGIVTYDILPQLGTHKRPFDAVVQVPKEECEKDLELTKDGRKDVNAFGLRPALPTHGKVEPEVEYGANTEIVHMDDISDEPEGWVEPIKTKLPSVEEVEKLEAEFPPKIETNISLVPEGVAVN